MDEQREMQVQEQVGEIQKQLVVISSLPLLNEAQVADIGGRLFAIYSDAEQLGDGAFRRRLLHHPCP